MKIKITCLMAFSILLQTVMLYSSEKPRIAVLDLNASGMPKTSAKAISSMVRSQLIDSGQFIIVERGQMDSILNEQGFQQTGCTDDSCAVQIGKLLSANKMLIGDANKFGNSVILTCRIVDVEKGVAEYSIEQIAENENSVYPAVKKMVKNLVKRMGGRVRRDYSTAPEGFYLSYSQTIIQKDLEKSINVYYRNFFGGTIGYLHGFNEHLSFFGDITFQGNSYFEASMILNAYTGGIHTGFYLHDRVYFYIGLAARLALFIENGKYSTETFFAYGGDAIGGLKIMFTDDMGMYLQSGYSYGVATDNAKTFTGGILVSAGVLYNFF